MLQIRRLIVLITIMILGVSAESNNKCCKDDGHLDIRTKRCNDGTKPFLDCNKYLYKKKRGISTFTLDAHENLVIEEIPSYSEFVIEHGSYCLGNLTDKDENVALICFDESDEPFWELRAGCAILSIIFMILVLIVYILVPILRDLQGKCTMHAVANLTVAYVVLTTVQLGHFDSPACEILGFNIYFFFLSAFAWLNVTCFHVWRATVRPTISSSPKYIYWFSIGYAYGIPFIFLAVALISHSMPGDHLKPGIGINSCWITGEMASWVYFYIPITFVLTTNIIMFCWTGRIFWKTIGHNFRQNHRLKVLKTKCILYAKLSVIMGLTWIFEILSYIFSNSKGFIQYIWVVFDYVNTLQGILIFLVLVLFRKRAIKGIAERGLFCFKKCREIDDNESEDTDVLSPCGDELRELNNKHNIIKQDA